MRHWQPEIDAAKLGPREAARRDADDAEQIRADPDVAADDIRAAAVPAAPGGVTQHDDPDRTIRRIVGVAEEPADGGLHAEEREESRGRVAGAGGVRLSAVAGDDVVDGIGRHGVERRRATRDRRADFAQRAGRERTDAGRLRGEIQPHHPIGVADVIRSQDQQPIDDAEHRGVGANAEHQRDDDENRERGRASQPAPRDANVLSDAIHDEPPWGWRERGFAPEIAADAGDGRDRVGDGAEESERPERPAAIEGARGLEQLVAKLDGELARRERQQRAGDPLSHVSRARRPESVRRAARTRRAMRSTSASSTT
jgi:hypothetical protein